MFKITKLRISGFKSFPFPKELEISDGITGIIGPNGCGKSNIFEAIRWVYDIRMIDKKNKIINLRVDAGTSTVLDIESAD